MPDLSAFHFLRPLWLWALLAIAVIALALARQQSAAARWRGMIAPHLLEHLVVRPRSGWRVRPAHALVTGLVLATVAAAGPSWRREPPPFTEDTAPLVLAIDLSPTMLVEDVRPSRLERAKQKVQDLLEGRKGAKTALIVFAGSAHMVLPLTDDPSVISSFVTALDPSIMPVAGKKPAEALRLASEMLANEPAAGTVLFLTDGIASAAAPAFAHHSAGSQDQVVVLAIATEGGGVIPGSRDRSTLDRAGLEAVAQAAGAVVVGVSADDSDVQRVLRRVDTHLAAVQSETVEGRWRDQGWWLIWPVALLTSLWFRRGWLIQWEG